MLETITVVGVWLADRLVKWWAMTSLQPLGTGTTLLPSVLELRYVENTGAAFSILSGSRWLLVAVALLLTGGLIFYLIRYRKNEHWCTRLALAAILGGALGNLADRLFYGYVVDMFNPLFIDFAVFNVADIFLCCGTALLIFMILCYPALQRRKAHAA